MKENKIEELKERLEELHRIQEARLACNADDLDIREEIAEVEDEITTLQSKEDSSEILDLCREYTIKLLELQKVKTKGVNLFEPSKEKKCELAMIDKSIEYLRRNKWEIV